MSHVSYSVDQVDQAEPKIIGMLIACDKSVGMYVFGDYAFCIQHSKKPSKLQRTMWKKLLGFTWEDH